MSKAQHIGNWKIVNGNEVYLKVTGFPSMGEAKEYVAGESMWVIVVEGDDTQGIGTIANHPVCSDLEYGALIRYGEGTDDIKPKFIEVVASQDAAQHYFTEPDN